MLNIRVDFLTIRASNGLIIENDVDLLLILELYKDNHVITPNISPLSSTVSFQLPIHGESDNNNVSGGIGSISGIGNMVLEDSSMG